MVKRLFVVVAVLLAVGLAVGAAGVYFATRPGAADDLTGYLGRQVVGIANAHLVPDLAFDTARFESPGTLRLFGVRLTAADGTDVLDIGSMVVTLEELPSIGRPIRIASIEIADGDVNLLRDPATGRFRGLSPLVERGPTKESQAGVEENFRLSNVLVLERVVLRGIDLAMDLGDGAGPMVIEGFRADLAVEPAPQAVGEPSGPGWYRLAFTSGRSPGLELEVEGRLSIDTFEARIASGVARATLEPATYDTLPGPIATLLRERDARGDLRLNFAGSVPMTNPLGGADLTIDATLTALNMSAGEYRVPIDSATARATLAGGVATVPSVEASMVNGTLTARGRADLTATGRPAELSWTASGLDIERFLRDQQSADAPDLAGILHGAGSASTRLSDPLASMSGSGEVRITDGRLLALPALSALAEAARVAGMGDSARNHKADAAFTLTGQGLRLDSSEITTNSLAARATGLVGYDGSLDLRANAGPMEKLQSALGKVGDLLGRVTDQLVTYTITGELGDPRVGVAPLGIGG